MRKLLSLLLVVMLNVSVFSQVSPNPPTTPAFFDRIDLTRPDMARIAALVSASNYDAALEVWRDTVVNRLRRLDLGQFRWHSNCRNGYYINFAKMLVGNITPTAYYAGSTSYDDYYGITNSPYNAQIPINWIALPPAGTENNDYPIAEFKMFVTLPSTYYQTSDVIYLKKFIQVASDFAVRQKSLISSLSPANQALHSPNWKTTPIEVLKQGDRVGNIIRCLGVLAKNLPGEAKIDLWDEVITRRRTPVVLQNRQIIDAKELSNIVYGLVNDNPSILLAAYRNAGYVPNQRYNGLNALMMLCLTFPEFKAIPLIEAETIAGLTDYMNIMCAKDGGFLEQSFNYNIGDSDEMDALVRMIASAGRSSMPLRTLIFGKSNNFKRMVWALHTPLMAPPLVGNFEHSKAPNVWDSTVANSYRNEIIASSDILSQQIVNDFKDRTPAPFFTSISFPYSGYYAQRKGWKIDDPYLFFMAGRPARGHKMGDNNSIQVVAYGRELLATDGPPDYFDSLTPEQRTYLAEASSLKTNTVIVDGKSQNKNTILQAQDTNPITTRFYNSSTEDFVEGIFDDGYCDIGGTSATVTDVTHHRQVIFLKESGIWIMSDLMNHTGTNTHTYSQVWNFEPYEPLNNIFGYTASQVSFDKPNKRIVTQDAAGPNIRLQNFGKLPTLDYVKFYNQTSPTAMGWYAPSISTITPAVDIHAKWTGTGNQALGTIIVPSRSLTPNVVYQDLSPDAKTAVLSATLPNGNLLKYSAGFIATTTTQFSFTFKSKGYMLQKRANGDVTGMVIGGDGLPLVWNGNTIPHGFTDYAINYSVATGKITLSPFKVPNTFVWDTRPVASIMLPNQSDVVWINPLGTESNDDPKKIIIYPNPSSQDFQLLANDDIKFIKAYDVSGKEILSTTNASESFGLNWTAGVYIIKAVDSSGSVFIQRVVKLN
jgi:Heparinase II/III-like protein/Secretion system C-terminal sorting domain